MRKKNYQSNKNCHFIIYEELTNPDYIKIFHHKINSNQVENFNFKYFKNLNKKEIIVDCNKKVFETVDDIYRKFNMNSI